MKVLCQE